MDEIVKQIFDLIEPVETEKNIIAQYIKAHDITQFLENYDSLNISGETKEKIETIKTILDASV